MRNMILVGVLAIIAFLRILKQGYFDIINSGIILLAFMWFVRNRIESTRKKVTVEHMHEKDE